MVHELFPYVLSWFPASESPLYFEQLVASVFAAALISALLVYAVVRCLHSEISKKDRLPGQLEASIGIALSLCLICFGLLYPLAELWTGPIGLLGMRLGALGTISLIACTGCLLLLEWGTSAAKRAAVALMAIGAIAVALGFIPNVAQGLLVFFYVVIVFIGFFGFSLVFWKKRIEFPFFMPFLLFCIVILLAIPLGNSFAQVLPLGVYVAFFLRLPKTDTILALGDPPDSPLLSDYVDKVSLALTRFIPKEFLAILNKQTVVDLSLGDHVKRDMTIFFSDIRQFTNLSEGLTPEESFKFINSYLSRIVPVITDHGGFVDKYMGDAIMALYPDGGGADGAVRTAIEMQAKIVEYNSHRANCGYRPLSMGIGLHTGTLMLGVVGVADRMQNTVISDAVNLASRLESITKVFNISMAISEETFKSLEDPGAYMYRFIGKVRVKGKSDPVSVFEIFDGIDPGILERKMRANIFFEQGMLSYYHKDFPGAMFNFKKVLEILPEDGASAFYLDNCMLKVRA